MHTSTETRHFFLFSIVRHASTQLRMPAPRGMASQHLRTFERVPVNKELLTGTVLVNKKLLTGTVPVNNLFLYFNGKIHTNICLVNVFMFMVGLMKKCISNFSEKILPFFLVLTFFKVHTPTE